MQSGSVTDPSSHHAPVGVRRQAGCRADAYVAGMGNMRTGAVGLYLLAVLVRVLTWGGTSATDRSDDVVFILLAGAVIAAILSADHRRRKS